MSIPLKDFRCAIPESVDIWLDAVAASTGADKAAVARDVLKQWAKQKHREHTVAARRMAANGLQMELDGVDAAEGGAAAADGGVGRRARR